MMDLLAQAPIKPAALPVTSAWDLIVASVRASLRETSAQKWLVLLGLILAGLIAGQIFQKLFRAMAERSRKREAEVRAAALDATAGPLALLFLVAGVAAGLSGVAMDDDLRNFVLRLFVLLNVVVVGWFLFNAIDVLDLLMRRSMQSSGHASLFEAIPMVRKALRLFLVIVLLLFTAQNVFGRDVSTWLAGLGIAGLAVTLSAQDSIKNFFGSITILLDRPFALGDYIVIDGYEGTVEEIGFRSTRIRRSEGSLVTIPNSKAVEQSISNFTRRSAIRRTLDVLLPYDVPPAKLLEMTVKFKEILTASDSTKGFKTNGPPQIRLGEQKADKLTMRIVYWSESADRPAFYAYAERVNLALLEYFASIQIEARLMDVDVMMGKR